MTKQDLNLKLCEVLNLDPKLIRRLFIVADAKKGTRVRIYRYLTDENGQIQIDHIRRKPVEEMIEQVMESR